jgi:hypothetical protein
MKLRILLCCVAVYSFIAFDSGAQTKSDLSIPHLEKHGTATQPVVGGKPMLVDAILDGARQNHLQLVLIRFGSWKNGDEVHTSTFDRTKLKLYGPAISIQHIKLYRYR